MIRDITTYPSDSTVACDVCIIGGGAAGISMALEMSKSSKLKIILLEAGGREYDNTQQSQYEGTVVGRQYYNLAYDRVRRIGGSTNHWGGWCTPLSKEDLAGPTWAPENRWPISWEALASHYSRAAALVQIENTDFTTTTWMKDYPLLSFDRSKVASHMYQFSPPTKFGDEYRDELQTATNVDVVLYANVTRIDLNDARTVVSSLQAKSLEGHLITVKARHFVLAAGGLENPRILLSNTHQEPKGIGNRNDQVGRYFMDHLEGSVGQILTSNDDSRQWLNSYEKRLVGRIRVKPAVTLTPSLREKLRVGHVSFSFDSVLDDTSGYLSAKSLAQTLTGQRPKAEMPSHLVNTLRDLDEVALWLYHRVNGTNYEFPASSVPAKIMISGEAMPNPDSRVTLSDERDALGVPRIVLDWRLTAHDKTTILESSKVIANELARLTGNRIRLDESLLDGSPVIGPAIFGGHHHMGTTRMSSDPTSGVVDANCQVHGIANLFVAGSSVFPTYGFANPTLSIVALSVRLADELSYRLRTG